MSGTTSPAERKHHTRERTLWLQTNSTIFGSTQRGVFHSSGRISLPRSGRGFQPNWKTVPSSGRTPQSIPAEKRSLQLAGERSISATKRSTQWQNAQSGGRTFYPSGRTFNPSEERSTKRKNTSPVRENVPPNGRTFHPSGRTLHKAGERSTPAGENPSP